MTELFETDDVHDRRLVRGLSGLLGAFNEAGLLEAADVHVAQRLCSIVGETDETVALAVGVAVRAVRHGSVCVDLAALVESLPTPPVAAPRRLAGPRGRECRGGVVGRAGRARAALPRPLLARGGPGA